jgi:hypothetical protein
MKKLYNADFSPYSARVRMQIYAKAIREIVFELPERLDAGIPTCATPFAARWWPAACGQTWAGPTGRPMLADPDP